MTYRILTICTGNICRSPLTQQLITARLAGLPISCASAGTGALDGQPMDPRAAASSTAHGGDPEPHRGKKTIALGRHYEDFIGLNQKAAEHSPSRKTMLPKSHSLSERTKTMTARRTRRPNPRSVFKAGAEDGSIHPARPATTNPQSRRP